MQICIIHSGFSRREPCPRTVLPLCLLDVREFWQIAICWNLVMEHSSLFPESTACEQTCTRSVTRTLQVWFDRNNFMVPGLCFLTDSRSATGMTEDPACALRTPPRDDVPGVGSWEIRARSSAIRYSCRGCYSGLPDSELPMREARAARCTRLISLGSDHQFLSCTCILFVIHFCPASALRLQLRVAGSRPKDRKRQRHSFF